MKKIFPSLVYNPITIAGSAIALTSFGLILFLIVLEMTAHTSKPYMGIIAFVILPAFLIMGLLIVAYGVLKEHKKRQSGQSVPAKFPVIDLNETKQRTAVLFFSVVTILLLVFSAFGSYKAYEYTDSDEFCGTICHTVMEPEYVAYQSSPHSKVGCVKCHIGPGADWFVRAKISGAYQVYSVLFDKYSRPIPTPIKDLRPAQETCEQCHWPKHFFSEKKVSFDYFLSDEKNTRTSMSMLLKIGGGNSEVGITSGIHWHMNIANEISYIASDETRQSIPWVKMKSNDGKETVYYSEEAAPAGFTPDAATARKMDCIDCHNRPSHIFNEPDRMVNLFISSGLIDSTLPYIKSIAVQSLEIPYTTRNEGNEKIEHFIRDFYSANYADIAKTKKESITQAVQTVKRIFARNYFPEMKVSWKRFPDNIGHMYYNGCFRCHDGKHKSKDGKVISKECGICHSIIAQETSERMQQVSMSGLTYAHPVDLGDAVEKQLCTDCHGVNKKKF